MRKEYLTQIEVEKRFADKNLKLNSLYKGTKFKVKCICFCGKEFEVSPSKVFNSHTRSCGCYAKTFHTKTIDLVGKKFGKLTVEKLDYVKDGNVYWRCVCECGKEKIALGTSLKIGHTTSCGCAIYQYDTGKQNYKWNGYGEISGHCWSGIKKNAKNRNKLFEITIEEAWELFEKQGNKCALTDVPLKFADSYKTRANRTASLDRINSDYGYISGNVRWIHKDLNNMKWDFSEEEFIQLCYLICNPLGCNGNIDQEIPSDIGLTYFNSIKRNALSRNLVFEIDIPKLQQKFEDQNRQCVLTGLPLFLGYKQKQTASLDRIDNLKGYLIDNIQWIHKDINTKLRKDMSLENLKFWCNLVVKHSKFFCQN